MPSSEVVWCIYPLTLLTSVYIYTNSVDPDQTALWDYTVCLKGYLNIAAGDKADGFCSSCDWRFKGLYLLSGIHLYLSKYVLGETMLLGLQKIDRSGYMIFIDQFHLTESEKSSPTNFDNKGRQQ